MKWMLLVLVAACGGGYKAAAYATSPPPSVLEQHARLTEPIANAAEQTASVRTSPYVIASSLL
jgi:hypothetical protein